MNKIAALCAAFVAAFSATSCIEYLDDLTENEARTLMLTSLINGNDSINYVYVAASSALNITEPRGLQLSVLVNGVKLDSVKLLSGEYKADYPTSEMRNPIVNFWSANDTTLFSRFRIRHRFHSGDHIRIEAKSDCCEEMAWGETVVPVAAAKITKVDTTIFLRQKTNHQAMQLNIDIEDNLATQDYFRLEVCSDIDFFYQTPIGGVDYVYEDIEETNENGLVIDRYRIMPESNFTGRAQVTCRNYYFDNSEDIILTEGNSVNSVTTQTSPSSSTTVEFFPTYENTQNVFSDAVFAAGKAQLKVFVDYNERINANVVRDYLTLYARYWYTPRTRVRVHSISQEYFRYLKVFSILSDEDYEDWGAVLEPMTTYQNVNGGIGFVTSSMAAEYVISFPQDSFHLYLEDREWSKRKGDEGGDRWYYW